MPAPALAREPRASSRVAPRLFTPARQPDPLGHLGWARGIARGVSREYHFAHLSAEEGDLLAVADLVVCQYALKFDEQVARAAAKARDTEYDGFKAFKGYAEVEVRSRCRREAVRIRNGGTFHTARLENVRRVKVGGLPAARCGSCADVAAPALTSTPRPWWTDDAEDELSLAPHTIYDTTPDE